LRFSVQWFFLYLCLSLSLQQRVWEDVAVATSFCQADRQSKIHRLQVGLHGSEPGLPWTTTPPSPVVRWARNAGLESSVMILSGVGTVEMSNDASATCNVAIRPCLHFCICLCLCFPNIECVHNHTSKSI